MNNFFAGNSIMGLQLEFREAASKASRVIHNLTQISMITKSIVSNKLLSVEIVGRIFLANHIQSVKFIKQCSKLFWNNT